MDLGLRGKRAVVTGATRGIGRAIAEVLAREGTDIAVCARGAGGVSETIDVLRGFGVKASGAAVDVADGPALHAWIIAAAAELGGIDILVSSPGAMVRANTEADWASNFHIDLMGAVRSVEAAKPFLEAAARQHGDASIVFISSAAAVEAAEEGSYGPMKAALVHFAKGLARQQAPKGIRANVVSPGTIYFKDGLWSQVEESDPERFKATLRRNPMGRMGSAEEVARAVVFLASPASSFTTGINLLVDGAYTSRVDS